jgi:hypothetical protein
MSIVHGTASFPSLDLGVVVAAPTSLALVRWDPPRGPAVETAHGRPVQLDVVGGSFRQDALAAIGGPKEEDTERKHVGVTLRCEPSNPHDRNAVRVEVMGQHVAFIAREQAALLSPAILEHSRGVIEASGLIVGGWSRPDGDEGRYGIRVWITERDARRLGIPPGCIDRRHRPWPQLPPAGPGERRLSPTRQDIEAGLYGSVLTVTGEEHYQTEIESAMPTAWEPDRAWPLVVEFAIAASNPHTMSADECIEVRLADGATIGYLTPKMSSRYMTSIQRCLAAGVRPTATATASRGVITGGRSIWQIYARMLTC